VKANLLSRLRHKFKDEPPARKLRDFLDEETKFDSDDIKTLLLLVIRNATSATPWLLSNNLYAKYKYPERDYNNLNFPLRQLIRASAAASTYFPPEVILLPCRGRTDDKEFVFVDGGLTMYNNPAFICS
jgi:patatin-like phospholipase/acyl hydrolase